MDAKALPAHPNLYQYKKQAKDLLRAWDAGDVDAARRINAHGHGRVRTDAVGTDAVGTDAVGTDAVAAGSTRILADTQFVVAREHGFESWPKFARHIHGVADGPIRRFESAVDAVIAGDLATLEALLRAHPGLVRARSTRVHRATLLHYVAANGVEDFRQRTPDNAAMVAKLLLNAGAEVDATADMYGVASTTMDLLVSSVHPATAGVQVVLAEMLLDCGAAINGVADDGSPLLTALGFHYPDAAEALARRGARVDTIIAAAGLGRDDLVRSFVDADGRLRADVPLAAGPWPHLTRDPAVHVERALILAAALGRVGVVDLLSKKWVDVRAKDDQGFTALHWAAFRGHLQVVDLLLDRGAPLEAKTKFGGTVLGTAVWASGHSLLHVDYAPVVRRLLDAGASVAAIDPRPSGNRGVEEVLSHHGARAR